MNLENMIHKNLLRWNEITSIHEKSAFYDVAQFKAGACTLKSIELEEVDDVKGKSLLHLQCHFGLDTLSWARLGARVTGIDLSDEAVTLAQSLNDELGLDARFICSDVYKTPAALNHEKFDVVFTSYGVLCWLADIEAWARIISDCLKPGGTFFIAEGHPVENILEWDNEALKVAYPYFDPEPIECSSETSYADRTTKVSNTDTYQWQHSLGSIVCALIDAGLTIESLKEYPFSSYEKYPGYMELCEDGWWRFKSKELNAPLLFSIKATKTK
ncbi:class I SAM-dependent methyltransferase [Paenibacillus allorhizosphaerae]|uniref:Ubiquinone biosynthesis O-methyltransferase, mitochondrial n=1 Tax=Paenibacillus allorhizosphaerae TaxID=2849866 RepID=A0ABM8VT69_9BACL|nr:class I SAM-dependent methyltransferase [Paenibacillus allorhizosphaerae]CAG7657490.1 Ubiquinone biosynthesis O-methyltransferase, mitochondrial [Paenibacillus allorhizosphaerae]